MYNPSNELKLLLPDISDRMTDYVGIQLDIEDTKVISASIVAQDLDIKSVITKYNWERCFEENENYSEELYDLIIPALCFLSYARLVSQYQISVTDSGASVEEGALSVNEAKAASKAYRAVGESYLGLVVDWLEQEDSSTEATMDRSVQRIRSFGGEELFSHGSGNNFSKIRK